MHGTNKTTTPSHSPDDRPNDLIDSTRAARELHVSRHHVVRWILKGKIRAWRTGKRYYVSMAEVQAMWKPASGI